jgi:hypothetical protein
MNLSHAPAYYVAVAFKPWVQTMAYMIVMMVNGHVGDATNHEQRMLMTSNFLDKP